MGVVLKLFAQNPRSNKLVIEKLGNAADMAYTEAFKPDADMFGPVPRATREQVMNQLEPQNEPTSTQNLEQPAGRGGCLHELSFAEKVRLGSWGPTSV